MVCLVGEQVILMGFYWRCIRYAVYVCLQNKNSGLFLSVKKCCSTAFLLVMDLQHYIFCMIQRSALEQGASFLLNLYMWCGTSSGHGQSHCPFCRSELMELARNFACMREWAALIFVGELCALHNFPLLHLNLQTLLAMNQTLSTRKWDDYYLIPLLMLNLLSISLVHWHWCALGRFACPKNFVQLNCAKWF